VRPIATTGSARSPVYPNVATVAESGLPGFDVDLWIGIYAPVGMPPAVLAKLNGELNKVLQHPELKAAFAKIGISPRGHQSGRGRGLHPFRVREMEEGDRRGQDQARVAVGEGPTTADRKWNQGAGRSRSNLRGRLFVLACMLRPGRRGADRDLDASCHAVLLVVNCIAF